MKKIITVLSILSFHFAFGQTDSKTDPNYKTYFSFSAGVNSGKQAGISGEVGRWGIKSMLSYSLCFDLNASNSTNPTSTWIGPKAYFTIFEKDKFSYMLYGSPKICLSNNNGENNFLIENGVSFNYNQNANTIFSFTIFFQSSQTYNLQPGISISAVIL